MSKSNVHRDVELEALREQVGQLQIELSERKMDIERYIYYSIYIIINLS